jgi:anti-sigma factor ChrR (cupin superfamily)
MSSSQPSPSLRGDPNRRETVDTAHMEWSPSPSPSVWRKRLHLVGGAESGQVTSVVRYDAHSRFPEHDHPEGEEIFVLEGVFSDHRGDHGPGSYLLNPEGHRHAPWSDPGCVIFVKLRQYAGLGREYIEIDTRGLPWTPTGREGVEEKPLYADPRFPDVMRLERWSPGTAPDEQRHAGGAEIFVVEGVLEDEHGRFGPGAWLRLPPGVRHTPRSAEGAVVYVKTGGVASLRAHEETARGSSMNTKPPRISAAR